MRTKILMALSCLVILVSYPVFSADYYVSPNGGKGTGSINDPWDIPYANTKLQAGDKAILRGGIYTDQIISPSNSGTASNPITYIAFSGEKPEFRGSTRGAVDFLIVLINRSYIIVDGISADGEGVYKDSRINRWVVFDNTTYCTIQNSNFRRSRGYVAMDFRKENGGNSHHNKILNNVVDTNGTWDIFKWDGVHDDSGSSFWIKSGNHHNLIEGNLFRRSGHDGGIIQGDFNIVRNNTFDNDWGIYSGPSFVFKQGDIKTGDRVGNRSISIKSGNRNLIEGNVFKNVPESVDNSAVGMIKLQGVNQIVRNNYFMNANHDAITNGIGKSNREGEYNVVYHNTFYNIGGPVWRIQLYDSNYGSPKNNILKNNVMYKTNFKAAEGKYNAVVMYRGLLKYWGDAFLDNVFAYNCVASDETASGQMVNTEATAIKTLSVLESSYNKYFHDNLQVVPGFVSQSPQNAKDLQLTSNSLCRNRGGDLTTTTGSGSGTKLRVADVTYFSDGYGMIEGDLIKIGTNSAVRIKNINYSTNEITVSASINWIKGDGVNLNFSGVRPDMGVLVNGINTVNNLTPPTNLKLILR